MPSVMVRMWLYSPSRGLEGDSDVYGISSGYNEYSSVSNNGGGF